jgi:hypothetical protein
MTQKPINCRVQILKILARFARKPDIIAATNFTECASIVNHFLSQSILFPSPKKQNALVP